MMSMHIALYCGHENEYREIREGTKRESSVAQNEFKVLDRFGTIIQTTNSQQEAQKVSKKNIGSSIVRTSGATATVPLNGRQRRVPADFFNTDHSPIHDEDGAAHRLHYEEGVAEEDITQEMIQQYEMEMEESEMNDSEDAWKYM
jgi:hypothetical protein